MPTSTPELATVPSATLPAASPRPATGAPAEVLARLLLTTLRPHQWVKNGFVLAPLLFGRKLMDLGAVGQALLAFAAFCVTSSLVYVLNDLWDAAEDRVHPEKRRRPIASGDLSASSAFALVVALVVTDIALLSQLGAAAGGFVLAYAALMIGYCVCLKQVTILDCVIIAVGFVLRVGCGAAAVGVEPSHWLIACTFLLTLFLAFAKRRQELVLLANGAADHRPILGGYTVAFLDQVTTLLAGTVVVCYLLYAVAPETTTRFGTDALVYGTVFVVYGLLRYLALLHTSGLGGDPSRAVVRDVPLLLATLGWVAFNALVIYRPFLGPQGDHSHLPIEQP